MWRLWSKRFGINLLLYPDLWTTWKKYSRRDEISCHRVLDWRQEEFGGSETAGDEGSCSVEAETVVRLGVLNGPNGRKNNKRKGVQDDGPCLPQQLM